jgi:hypothetical protein
MGKNVGKQDMNRDIFMESERAMIKLSLIK